MSNTEQLDDQRDFSGLNEVAVPLPLAKEIPADTSRPSSKKSNRKSLLPQKKKKSGPSGSSNGAATAVAAGASSNQKPTKPNSLYSSSSSPSGGDEVKTAEPQVGYPVTDASHAPEGLDANEKQQRDDAQPALEDQRPQATHAPSSEPNPTHSSPIPRIFREKKDLSGIQVSSTVTKIYTWGYLVLFSILGVLARLGLQSLTFYPNAPVQQGLVWANFTGSFVMGFLSEDRQLFRHEWGGKPLSQVRGRKKSDEGNSTNVEDDPDDTASIDTAAEKKRHGAVKKTIPLFVGLATGFCGSCTSFSSFQRDTFLILANSAPSPETPRVLGRNGGYSFLAVLASLIVTPALSLVALQAGAHTALALQRVTPSLDFYFVRGFLDPVACALGFGAWLGAVFMAIWPPDRPHGPAAYYHETWEHETWRGQAIFACVFAPLGTLVRYYVSMWLNPRVASFPLGTFAVNIGGTLVEGLFYDLQHAKLPAAAGRVGGGRVPCQVLQGLQDGFCGCLTTVSTWVAELKGLRRKHAYLYGFLSSAVGVGIMVIVMGSLRWTHGFYAPQCVT